MLLFNLNKSWRQLNSSTHFYTSTWCETIRFCLAYVRLGLLNTRLIQSIFFRSIRNMVSYLVYQNDWTAGANYVERWMIFTDLHPMRVKVRRVRFTAINNIDLNLFLPSNFSIYRKLKRNHLSLLAGKPKGESERKVIFAHEMRRERKAGSLESCFTLEWIIACRTGAIFRVFQSNGGKA